MRFGFKVIGWLEYDIDDEKTAKEIIEKIKKGEINSFCDIDNTEEYDEEIRIEFNLESCEQLCIEENKGMDVIEVEIEKHKWVGATEMRKSDV